MLLSDGLWRRRFGADPAVVGRTIAFDGNAFEVVGVLPASLLVADPSRRRGAAGARRSRSRAPRRPFLDVIGRLRDDVSPAQAREDLRIIGARLSQAYPFENANHAPNLRPLRDALVGDVRPALLVLLGAVAFVMLIACANVATLLLARAAGRQKELSVRRAVGATRWRVVQQMLTESLVVAFAGGVGGVARRRVGSRCVPQHRSRTVCRVAWDRRRRHRRPRAGAVRHVEPEDLLSFGMIPNLSDGSRS